MRLTYKQAWEGEWITPQRRGWRMRCCDCKLVHVIDFRVRNGHVQMKPRRDNRATAASRRKKS